jgi:hypothetical protein
MLPISIRLGDFGVRCIPPSAIAFFSNVCRAPSPTDGSVPLNIGGFTSPHRSLVSVLHTCRPTPASTKKCRAILTFRVALGTISEPACRIRFFGLTPLMQLTSLSMRGVSHSFTGRQPGVSAYPRRRLRPRFYSAPRSRDLPTTRKQHVYVEFHGL